MIRTRDAPPRGVLWFYPRPPAPLMTWPVRRLGKVRTSPAKAIEDSAPTAVVLAARRLNRASGAIAGSVLIDSAMEHYRGNFRNKAMWTPTITSALSIGASLHGVSDNRHFAHPVRDLFYALAGLVGIVGTGFHIYNIISRLIENTKNSCQRRRIGFGLGYDSPRLFVAKGTFRPDGLGSGWFGDA